MQNNMRELFGLMNLLDDVEYRDEDDFFEKFGGDKEAITLPQVQALQVSPLAKPPTSPHPPCVLYLDSLANMLLHHCLKKCCWHPLNPIPLPPASTPLKIVA